MARFRMPYIPVEDPFMTGISQGQQMMGQFVDPLMNTMIQAGQLRRQQEIDAENRSRYEDEMAMRQAEIDRLKGQRQEDIARAQGIRQEDLTSRYLTARNQFAVSIATEPIYDDQGRIVGKKVNPETYQKGLETYDQYSSNMPGYVPIPQPPEWSYQGTMSPAEYNQVPKYYRSPERQFQIGKGTKQPSKAQTGGQRVPEDIWEQTPIQALGTIGSEVYQGVAEPVQYVGSEIARGATQPIGQTANEILYPVRHPLQWMNENINPIPDIQNYLYGTEVTPQQEAMMGAPNPEWMPEPMTTASTRVQPRQRKRKQYSPYMQ